MPAGGAISETKKALPCYGKAHYTSISDRIIVRMQVGAQGANEILNQLADPELPGAILSPVSCRTAMGSGGELRRGNE